MEITSSRDHRGKEAVICMVDLKWKGATFYWCQREVGLCQKRGHVVC